MISSAQYRSIPTLAATFLVAASVVFGAVAPTCQPCHSAIVATQSATRMAQTWRGNGKGIVPATAAAKQEAGIRYSLSGVPPVWRVVFGANSVLSAPVESVLGGSRHGYSLLARVTSVNGAKLERAPLVETRYLLAPDKSLAFSPGHPSEKPGSWETAIGRVMSPWFESRCLACHAASSDGIHCEQCHGSGPPHSSIVNPAKLSNEARVSQCGQCHSDGRELADPMPEDLLIASQADALRRSECYIQSGKAFNCSTCHDPHKDTAATDSRYVSVCLSCHATGAGSQAVVCPVNQAGGCIECHMPSQPRDSFRMVDHWIRVVGSGTHTPAKGTAPQRVFLRMSLVPTRSLAEEVLAMRSTSFSDLARRYSQDPTAASGGYMGAMMLDQMNPALAKAVAALGYGERSGILQTPRGFFLFERQPRDFRWRADSLFLEASELKRKGQIKSALEKNAEALAIYPDFLRALLFQGVSAGEQGDAGRAVRILESAARRYPLDTGTQLNLGIAYGATGRSADEIAAYRRALDGEPDLVSAQLNLGAAYLAAGRVEEAAQAYRDAIDTNPLSAAAYYNLGIVFARQGKTAEARTAMNAAAAIDRRFAKGRTP